MRENERIKESKEATGSHVTSFSRNFPGRFSIYGADTLNKVKSLTVKIASIYGKLLLIYSIFNYFFFFSPSNNILPFTISIPVKTTFLFISF